MRRGFPLNQGKETWSILSEIQNKGYSYFFTDWLDLILNSLLSLTENMEELCNKKDILAMNKGQYNDRYMEIVKKYQERDEGKKIGERTIDLFAKAWGSLHAETLESKKDILGEIFQAKISYGANGQFFTPEHITDCMSAIAMGKHSDKPETIMDPCVGSGRMLLSAAKENPEGYFVGQDIDEVCCKMAAINLWMFNLNGEIRCGNSLTNEISKRWIIRKGGFIYEDLKPKIKYSREKIEKQSTLKCN